MLWNYFKKSINERLVSTMTTLIKVNVGAKRFKTAIDVIAEGDIAILVPHPDDEIIGCFHFINSIGDHSPIDLHYVTDGSSGGRIGSTATHILRRKNESLSASSKLTIRKRQYWGFEDAELKASKDRLYLTLSAIVTSKNYKYILCPAPNDLTEDHRIIAENVLKICNPSQLIWYRSTWLTYPLHDSDFISTGSEKDKIDALRSFKSQSSLALLNSVRSSTCEAKLNGLTANSLEAFRFASSGSVTWTPINTLSITIVKRVREWYENSANK